MTDAIWTAPVRFAEADQQGIVFNAHYLTYCDEAMGAFLVARSSPGLDLVDFAARVRLVSSTLTWTGSARWGDVVEVTAACSRVGRSSLTIVFDVRASGRECCRVETVYVHTDPDGAPREVPSQVRAALRPASGG